MKIHKEDDTDYDDNTDSDLCYVHLNTTYTAGYLGYYLTKLQIIMKQTHGSFWTT